MSAAGQQAEISPDEPVPYALTIKAEVELFLMGIDGCDDS